MGQFLDTLGTVAQAPLNAASGLLDWMDKHNISASIARAPSAGQAENMVSQSMAQQRSRGEQRQRAESMFRFMQDYMKGAQSGEVTPKNVGSYVVDLFGANSYPGMSPDEGMKIATQHMQWKDQLDRISDEDFNRLINNRGGSFWSDYTPETQATMTKGWGRAEGAPPPGATSKINPRTGQEDYYFPSAGEQEQEGRISLEQRMKELGVGRYSGKPKEAQYIKVMGQGGKPQWVEDTPENRKLTPWTRPEQERKDAKKTYGYYARVYPELSNADPSDRQVIATMIERGENEEEIYSAIAEALSKVHPADDMLLKK